MNADWQSWAAPAVVLLTAGIMAYRLCARKKPGCSAGCGCANGKLRDVQKVSAKGSEVRFRSASNASGPKRVGDRQEPV